MRPSAAALGQTVALTVATILGTGILGLPVALYQSGIQPLLFLFFFNLLGQVTVIYAGCELLLRAFRRKHSKFAEGGEDGEGIMMKETRLKQPTDLELQGSETEAATHGTMVNNSSTLLSADGMSDDTSAQPVDDDAPSLHSLADLFIRNKFLQWGFHISVMLHFVFILVTYALAAPQAYSTIIPLVRSLSVFFRTTGFIAIMSTLVYLLPPALLPLLSFGTLLKGILLIVLVLLTFVTGLTIHRHSVSAWALPYFVDPLLMSNMALSGTINIMPVTFQACLTSVYKRTASILSVDGNHNGNDDGSNEHELSNDVNVVDKEFIVSYRRAIVVGVFICFVLNIVWCMAVLMVVPQTPSAIDSSETLPVEATLQYANEKGLISTIPLMAVLTASKNKLNHVVGFLINLFISISLTISFLVVSLAMLHYINGSIAQYRHISNSDDANFFKRTLRSKFFRYWFGGVSFTYFFAVLNPQGVLKIMEGITTLALNFEAGVFVAYMFHESRAVIDSNHQEMSHNSGILSPLQARICTTYMVIFFLVVVVIDSVFYLPKSLF